MDSIEQLLAELGPEQRAALLAQLEGGDPGAVAGPGDPLRRADAETPLSSGQQRLWFLHQLEPDNPAYHVCYRMDWPGTLDVAALTSALGDLADRHESLRTRFRSDRDEPYQVVDPAGPVAVRRVDLSGLTGTDAARELERTVRQEADAPFDLERGPALRATAVLLPDGSSTVVLTQHHITCDGWSVDLLLDDLWRAYRARSTGHAPAFPELPLRYRDFALWQQTGQESGADREHLAYWREALGGRIAPLELPADRSRSGTRGRGTALHRTLPPELTASLQALGREHGTTLFTTMLAGFQALLHRWTGSPQVPVGAPVANRSRPEFEGIAGFFLNTLLLQADFSGDPAFADLLEQVRNTTADAFEHQDTPFERLVEELAPERQGGRNPLTPVLFAFNAHRSDPAHGPGPDEAGTLRSRAVEVDTSGARAELNVTVENAAVGDDGLRIAYEYDRDLFDPATIERLHGHYCRLLEAAAADPALKVSRLPVLTEAEERQLDRWNATEVAHPLDTTVAELIARQAALTPGATALIGNGETVSYRELDRRANRLAHRLLRLGVTPGDRVGVLLDRSPELVVALLGVLRAGAAYVPLDPSYPGDRLGYIVTDSAVPVIVGTEALAALLPREGDHGPVLIGPDADAALPETSPELPRDPDAIAYVIYTSGSTGRPKGVLNTHAGLVNHTLWMRDAFAFDAHDRVLQKTPMGFDVSMWELLVPLTAGATLVMAAPDGHKDPEYLARLIQEQQITVVHFVPSMLQVFLETTDLGACRTVRQVLCSGEALPPELLKRYLACGLAAPIDNLYGPTEAAIHVTRWTCGPQDTAGVPIGHPVDNTRLHVLDQYGSPVPVGRPGELHVGGVQVAAGYLGRPELTAEKFVADPFSGRPDDRLYRTGDLVRRRPDGALEFLGRLDHQVKLRGFRIELGEIEAVLAAHPAVSEAVVLLQDTPHGPRLVGYHTPADHADPVPEPELREHLGRYLPAYMVPAALLSLQAMPLSPNGKTDRGALARLTHLDQRSTDYVAPRDEVEQALADLFAELLGRDRVSILDSFFELGGHSLLATRLAARVRRDLGVDLPLRDLFDSPTVEALATRVVETLLGALTPEQLDAVLPSGEAMEER